MSVNINDEDTASREPFAGGPVPSSPPRPLPKRPFISAAAPLGDVRPGALAEKPETPPDWAWAKTSG